MRSILIAHDHRYHQWKMDDLYKLIHQAAMGSEHAMINETGAREWLGNELAHLGVGTDEPLLDPISADGRIVRIHLRTFAALRLPEEPLLQAFTQTARIIIPSEKHLAEYADIAIQLAQEGLLSFNADRLREYLARMHKGGYPATHHSASYVRLYRPAYRVAARDLLPREIIEAA